MHEISDCRLLRPRIICSLIFRKMLFFLINGAIPTICCCLLRRYEPTVLLPSHMLKIHKRHPGIPHEPHLATPCTPTPAPCGWDADKQTHSEMNLQREEAELAAAVGPRGRESAAQEEGHCLDLELTAKRRSRRERTNWVAHPES